MLKELIKKLSAEQKPLKKARKTGTYKCTWTAGWATNVPEEILKGWRAASQVQDNRLRITAALNLYHEQRGSDLRHGVDKSNEYSYKKYYKELCDLVASKP